MTLFLRCSIAYPDTTTIEYVIDTTDPVSGLISQDKLLVPVLAPFVGKIHEYVNGKVAGKTITPTAIYFNESLGIEIVTDFSHHRFVFRDIGSSAWSETKFTSLNQPHSLVYVHTANAYFAVDTNNDRIVSFPSVNSEESDIVDYSTLGSFTFSAGDRPHDIVFNPDDGYVYVIYRRGLLRFVATSSGISNVEVLTESDIEAGLGNYNFDYSRSLSVIDGKIYISASKRGNVVEIEDYSNFSTWSVHYNEYSVGVNNYASAGIWDEVGLVINDVEYLDGYWYGTNEYHDYQGEIFNATEKRTNKFIRWKSWDDFYASRWDDLGHLIPEGSNAYYMTVRQGKLYLSAFKTSSISRPDSNIVIRFDSE